jgi:hypothetical protein
MSKDTPLETSFKNAAKNSDPNVLIDLIKETIATKEGQKAVFAMDDSVKKIVYDDLESTKKNNKNSELGKEANDVLYALRKHANPSVPFDQGLTTKGDTTKSDPLKQTAEVNTALKNALKDGVITKGEAKLIEKEVKDVEKILDSESTLSPKALNAIKAMASSLEKVTNMKEVDGNQHLRPVAGNIKQAIKDFQIF